MTTLTLLTVLACLPYAEYQYGGGSLDVDIGLSGLGPQSIDGLSEAALEALPSDRPILLEEIESGATIHSQTAPGLTFQETRYDLVARTGEADLELLLWLRAFDTDKPGSMELVLTALDEREPLLVLEPGPAEMTASISDDGTVGELSAWADARWGEEIPAGLCPEEGCPEELKIALGWAFDPEIYTEFLDYNF